MRNPVRLFNPRTESPGNLPHVRDGFSGYSTRSLNEAQTRTVPKEYPLAYGDGFFEARTTLEIFFSVPSHKGGQRRIYDRIPDQSFQPWCHIVLWERRLVETYFNLELLMTPNNTDDRRSIAPIG